MNQLENNYLQQGTEEWHKFRKCHIGASDIGTILGINPYKSAYVLWLEMIGKKDKDETNEAMLRGQALEPIARDLYIEESGISVVPAIHVYNKWDILSASLDGISFDGKVILEIKCPSNRKLYDQAYEDKYIPEYYFAQMQQQLLITEADVCDFFVYFNKSEFTRLSVYPDYKYQENIVVKAKEFWHMVQTRTPPKRVEGDPEMVFDENINNLSQEWEELKKNIKNNEIKLKEKEEKIKEAIRDINSKSILFDKSSLKISKFEKEGNVDWKKLALDQNISEDIQNIYRKESSEIISFRL